MLAAKEPLVVPMLLRLSHFKLNSYVVLVVSKQKGITLVFKTDPLQNVDINSTFDSIAVIQKFIQREIEGQLRQMFREDLPGIIHRLSQQWVKAKVEAPYLDKLKPPPVARQQFVADIAPSELSIHSMPPSPGLTSVSHFAHRTRLLPSATYPRRPRSSSGRSAASTSKHKTQQTALPSPIPPDPVTFPDLENFDPTYGLRPEGLPTKSLFRGFSSLFTSNKGLADLAEDEEEEDDDEYEDDIASFDVVNWEYKVPVSNSSVYDEQHSPASKSEYETIPAVGGGTITRPRVYHSQSMIQTSSGPSTPVSPQASSSKHRAHLRSYNSLLSPGSGFTTSGIPTFFPETFAHVPRPPLTSTFSSAQSYKTALPHPAPFYFPRIRRSTSDSSGTEPSGSSSGLGLSTSTPPTEHPFHDDDAHDDHRYDPHHIRHPTPPDAPSIASPSSPRPSMTAASTLDPGFSSSPPPHHSDIDFLSSYSVTHRDPKIILRPSLNNSIHKLSSLSHSNHTLSPYTRTLHHFTVRSVPPRSTTLFSTNAGPVKARRKRTFRLGGGGKAKAPDVDVESGQKVELPRETRDGGEAEFDMSDMDRYFRAHDELEGDHPLRSQIVPSLVLESDVGDRRMPSSLVPMRPSPRPLQRHERHTSNYISMGGGLVHPASPSY